MLVSNGGAVLTQQSQQSAHAHAVNAEPGLSALAVPRRPGAIKLEGACRAHAAEHREAEMNKDELIALAVQ
jgi:hypothetical protein